MSKEFYTVSEYIVLLNTHLRGVHGEIVGEISEMSRSASGHVYFTIKDKETGEILPCIIWRQNYTLNGLDLEIGMEVLVKGVPKFYGPFGKLSFIAKTVELVGEGALWKAYEKLKKKLMEEGLFAEERKRPLPAFPKNIGVITSVHGEVIHDFNNNLRKSGFKVKILDSRVEGPESGRWLTLSVRAFRKEDIDVLILMRGGGSIQSLAGFDNEALVREIVSFPVPVIVGIGHHNDTTLVALTADAAESTPSFVAALLNKSWNDAERSLEKLQRRIVDAYEDNLGTAFELLAATFERAEETLSGILKGYGIDVEHISAGIGRMEQRIEVMNETMRKSGHLILRKMLILFGKVRVEFFAEIPRRMMHIYASPIKNAVKHLEQTPRRILIPYNARLQDATRHLKETPKWVIKTYMSSLGGFVLRVDTLARVIQGHDPQHRLRLGYSIASSGGKVVRSVRDLRTGQELDVQVSDGVISSEVKRVK